MDNLYLVSFSFLFVQIMIALVNLSLEVSMTSIIVILPFNRRGILSVITEYTIWGLVMVRSKPSDMFGDNIDVKIPSFGSLPTLSCKFYEKIMFKFPFIQFSHI
jgi:hypothetical protein